MSDNIQYGDNDALRDASPPPQSSQYDNAIQGKKVSNFISQTSPTNALVKIDWMLKGYIFNEADRKWEKVSEGIPESLRLDLIQSLSAHLSEDVRMGRLDMRQINDIMEFLIEWLIDYLDSKADAYLVDDKGKWHLQHESEQLKDREIQITGYNSVTGFIYEYIKVQSEENNGLRAISEEDLSKICIIIWSAIFYTLSRSLNGIERDKMYNALKLGDNLSDYAKTEERKSLLSSFLPWK